MSHSPTTPEPTWEEIHALCRERIAALGVQGPAAGVLAAGVATRVAQNMANGRMCRVANAQSKRTPLTLAGYVDIVLFHARQEQERVDALAAGDVAEWNRLLDYLRGRALTMIERFRPGADASSDASDFAQQALIVIHSQPYPCDVSFNAWVTTILKNLVLKRFTRSRDVLDGSIPPRSLDAPLPSDDESYGSLGDLLAHPGSLVPFEQVENQSLLFQVIGKLRSADQRTVILWTYIEQKDDAQIAHDLGTSRQEVYNLRRRALIRLRKIIRQEM